MAIISVSWRLRVESARRLWAWSIGYGANRVCHDESEARNELRVQSVGLGAAARRGRP